MLQKRKTKITIFSLPVQNLRCSEEVFTNRAMETVIIVVNINSKLNLFSTTVYPKLKPTLPQKEGKSASMNQ